MTIDITKLAKDVHTALNNYHTLGNDPKTLLADLLLVQQKRQELQAKTHVVSLRLATNDVLQSGLENLAKHAPQKEKVLRHRFLERAHTQKVAEEMGYGPDHVNRLQREGIDQLAEILMGQEQEAQSILLRKLTVHLPKENEHVLLFGVNELRAKLLKVLLHSNKVWVVAATGIGGIGKTALIDSLAFEAAKTFRFEHIFYHRVRGNSLGSDMADPAGVYDSFLFDIARQLWPEAADKSLLIDETKIFEALKQAPYLVVIDGLELEEDLKYILEKVTHFANPSRVLLTSRIQLDKDQAIHSETVNALVEADAIALMRHHAEVVNIEFVKQANIEQLRAIFEKTGGNPQALKLTIALLDTLPLQAVLKGLAQASPGRIEEMYRDIYWQSWNNLTPQAQTLLQVMVLIADSGAKAGQILESSTLNESDFWGAISLLHKRSLLLVDGTIDNRHYAIHRLTKTFLETEIIHLPEE